MSQDRLERIATLLLEVKALEKSGPDPKFGNYSYQDPLREPTMMDDVHGSAVLRLQRPPEIQIFPFGPKTQIVVTPKDYLPAKDSKK